ncbi:50S ribosomal protein L9 [Nostoc sp. NIES-2111]
MELILKEDVKGLGYKNDTVTVKPGYGRNFLVPQGMAVPATESNKKILAENIRQAAHKAEKIRLDAQNLANNIGELTITLKTKAGDSGKIFGKITSLQVADALKARGFDVDRKRIDFAEEIKTLGTYTANLNLHREVKHSVTVEVVEE